VVEIGSFKVDSDFEKIKDFGYGNPLIIKIITKTGPKELVLETMKKDTFGHEHFADRAYFWLWAYDTWKKLPKHVPAIDVGFFTKTGSMVTARDSEEYFLLTEKVEGTEYFKDLEKIKKTGHLEEIDLSRTSVLAEYLAEIHSVKHDEKSLYLRKIRDTVGHGECIFGILDNYPDKLDFVTLEDLIKIEKSCINLRWKLRKKFHRLSQIHGDFHPWNVLFEKDLKFVLLDRSRGEWGEPADDVSAMAINYLFYSLQTTGDISGPFKKLYLKFMEKYLAATGDHEILEVIQLFFIFRALVIASPVWYPTLPTKLRKSLFNFIFRLTEEETFEYKEINSYFVL
jgi:tRNA A-37 threonylcarbamoyl transferase component Bud32